MTHNSVAEAYGCVKCIENGDRRLYPAQEVSVKDHSAYCSRHAPKGAKKVKTSLTLHTQVIDYLDKQADEEGLSRSHIANRTLKEKLPKENE